MTKSKPKPASISPEQATAILKVEQERRLKAFEEAYQKLCGRYGCEIQARAGITADGRIGTSLIVGPTAQVAVEDE
jgi:hypothetical protein